MKSRWALCSLVLPLMLLACRSGTTGTSRQEVSAAPSVSAAPREPPPLCIEPAALEGCRSPAQKGCEVCYQPLRFPPHIPSLGGERCWKRSGHPADDRYAQTEMLMGPCPKGPRCAKCSLGSERKLRALYPQHWECSTKVEVDPCFVPDSQECLCEPYAFANEACPVVACP